MTGYKAAVDGADARSDVGPALELDKLARRFGSRWALRGVSLTLKAGEVVALTGPNGSGKTTLLRVAATLLRPTRGHGRVFGRDVVQDAAAVRPLIGFLSVQAGLYDELTAEENLRFAMRMAGRPPSEREIGAALEQVGLGAEKAVRIRGFSSGMRRRLALARIMLRPPRLLLLDEPYANFDADGVTRVNDLVRAVRDDEGAVLIATHDLARASGVVDRLLTIEAGRLVVTGAGPAGNGLWARPVRSGVSESEAVSQ